MWTRLQKGSRHLWVLLTSLGNRAERRQLGRFAGLLGRVVAHYERGGLPALSAALEPEPGTRLEASQTDRALAQVDALVAVMIASHFRTCLRRAALRYHVLRAAGRPVALVIGARKTKGTTTLDGHAWVEVAGQPFRESPEALAGMMVMYRHPAETIQNG